MIPINRAKSVQLQLDRNQLGGVARPHPRSGNDA
jgi:hypothetical protein